MALVAVDGVHIHYTVEGSGPPLVLQHGLSDSLESWYDFGYVAALSSDHTLVLIDARGHGGSDKPHDPQAYGRRPTANDIVAVLDDLGIARTGYLGVSMGGGIGLALGRWWPERVDPLVLVGAGAGVHTDNDGKIPAEPVDIAVEDIIAQWESQGAIPGPLKARLQRVDTEAIAALLAGFGPLDQQNEDVMAAYAGRYLFIAGDQDEDYAGIARVCSQLRPGCLITLEGINHLGSFTRSDLVLPHVRAFLAA